MFCKNCGQQIADNAAFCPSCGQATAQQSAPQGGNTQQAAVNQIFDTADHTAEYTQQDVQNGKAMSILCYIGILVLIPLFAEKNNKYVRFHVNQGFVLFVIEIALGIISAIFAFIPFVGIAITALASLASLATLALAILGIVNAASDKAKELPLIGSLKFVQ